MATTEQIDSMIEAHEKYVMNTLVSNINRRDAYAAMLDAANAPLLKAVREAPILSAYHGMQGFEYDRFIDDYSAWKESLRPFLESEGKDA